MRSNYLLLADAASMHMECLSSRTKKRTIPGIVKDSAGSTLPGFNINVKGTKQWLLPAIDPEQLV